MWDDNSCAFISDQIIFILLHHSCKSNLEETALWAFCAVSSSSLLWLPTASWTADHSVLFRAVVDLRSYFHVLEKIQDSCTEGYLWCLVGVPSPGVAGIGLERQFLLNGVALMFCHGILIVGVKEHAVSHFKSWKWLFGTYLLFVYYSG